MSGVRGIKIRKSLKQMRDEQSSREVYELMAEFPHLPYRTVIMAVMNRGLVPNMRDTDLSISQLREAHRESVIVLPSETVVA